MADEIREAAPKKSGKPASDPRARSWFIVCPNFRKNGVMSLEADYFKDMNEQEVCEYVVDHWCEDKAIRAAACLYCKSAKDMEHLHIVLCNRNAIRFSTVKKFIGSKAHIEETRGKKADVEAYLNKNGKFAEKGETILARAQHGELVGRQGSRSDLDFIRAAIDEGMTWQQVRRLNDRFFDARYATIIKSMYFDKRKQDTPFKRYVGVHWCLGESGSGKTGISLDLVEKYGEDNVYIVSDYKHGFDNYAGEPILILDELRDQLRFAELLSMLEGYKKEVAARYANVLALWNEVYITTVASPEEAYKQMIGRAETDNEPIAQLLSRLTDVSYCYRVNRPNGTKKDRENEPCDFYRFTVSGREYRELEGDRVKDLKVLAYAYYLKHQYQENDQCEVFGVAV